MQIMLLGQATAPPSEPNIALPVNWQELAAEQGYLVFTKEEWEKQQSHTPPPKETAQPAPAKPDPSSPTEVVKEVTVHIPNGYSSREISLLLERTGVIEDADAFEQMLLVSGKSTKLRIGVYTFKLPVTYEEVIDQLTSS